MSGFAFGDGTPAVGGPPETPGSIETPTDPALAIPRATSGISGHRAHMNDTDFDLDYHDATLAEHLKLFHGIADFDLFNHSNSFTVLQVSPPPMTWMLVSKDGFTVLQLYPL